MTRVIVSPQAEADLKSLIERIGDAAGERTAAAFVNRLTTTVAKLALVPNAAGRLVPALGPGLRCYPFGSYNLYLRHDAALDLLYLVRVLHSRRKVGPSLFAR